MSGPFKTQEEARKAVKRRVNSIIAKLDISTRLSELEECIEALKAFKSEGTRLDPATKLLLSKLDDTRAYTQLLSEHIKYAMQVYTDIDE